jgi:hypothetical protein
MIGERSFTVYWEKFDKSSSSFGGSQHCSVLAGECIAH